MTSDSPDNTLKSQYHMQVTGDLESNTREQERILAEVAALTEQLTTLEQDHELLTSMQQALAAAEAQAAAVSARTNARAETAAGSVPRARTAKKAGRTTAAAKAPEKTAAKASEKAPRKAAAKRAEKAPLKTAAKGRAKQASRNGAPTLRDLVSDQLVQQQEPRSAAEVTTALAQAYPQRNAGATVVRNTLEALVAKGQALRSKQQNSVFYTAAGTTEPAVPDTAADHAPVTA